MIYNFLHEYRLSHLVSKKILTENFLPFKLFYGLFKKLNWSKKIKKTGVSYTVILRNGIGLMNFISDYETWFDFLLPKLLTSPSGVFIDVGANTGQTLLKVVPFFKVVKYYAIEPNYACVEYLDLLCKVNAFNSVKTLNYALSDVDGETELLLRYEDDILATTSPSFRKYTNYSSKIKVPMTRGDLLLAKENIAEIAVIKIDVEGSESKVIAGLLSSIRLYQPYIICEILPLVSKSDDVVKFRRSSAQDLFSMLFDLEYIIYNIKERKTIITIDKLSTSLESCNYLFVPRHKQTVITG
jgi:FkbM family methyltransferase